jgi:RNA polymerase sigma factor (sigma-70 family)
MRTMARRFCRCKTLSDDAYQDAVIAFIVSLPSYRREAPLKLWLRRLLMSACARLRRGRRNNPAYNLPLDVVADDRDGLAQAPSQERRLLRQERLASLTLSLDGLDQLNRSLLLQHEGEGVSIDDLALRHGLSRDAVKSRLKRSRALLRTRLSATGACSATSPLDPPQ